MNDKKKILIIGGSSLLGLNWAVNLINYYQIYLSFNKTNINVKYTNKININFKNYIETKNKIKKINPDYIINLAAITDVDFCEINKKKAYHVNTMIPLMLSKIANILKCKLLHISTDQLFNQKQKFFYENSQVSPINYYAKSKYLGERKILKICKNYLIIRTNFFGHGTRFKNSYSEYILKNIKKNKKLYLSDKIFFNPIYICNLIKISNYLLKKDIKGLYNLTADDNTTKYEFGVRLCILYNLKKKISNISNVSSNRLLARRPYNMSLKNTKIKKIYRFKIGTVVENIKMMINDKNHKNKLKKYID